MNVLHELRAEPFLKKRVVGLIIIVIGLVVVLEIWTMNRLATYGEQIAKLGETKLKISLENQVLKNQIAKISSLSE